MFGFSKRKNKKVESYEKGMVAGAKPFEEKFEQHAEMVEKIANDTRSSIRQISEVTDIIIKELSDQQKKELYDLTQKVNYKTLLTDEQKEYTAAFLITISNLEGNSSNELQQNYIRSLVKYLGVKNPQTHIDISTVGNFESVTYQKTLLQFTMEYLFLDRFSFAFLEKYADVFDNFNVSNKSYGEIQNEIVSIVNAMGAKGISEKFGVVNDNDLDKQSLKEGMINAMIEERLHYIAPINTDNIQRDAQAMNKKYSSKSEYEMNVNNEVRPKIIAYLGVDSAGIQDVIKKYLGELDELQDIFLTSFEEKNKLLIVKVFGEYRQKFVEEANGIARNLPKTDILNRDFTCLGSETNYWDLERMKKPEKRYMVSDSKFSIEKYLIAKLQEYAKSLSPLFDFTLSSIAQEIAMHDIRYDVSTVKLLIEEYGLEEDAIDLFRMCGLMD